MSTNYFIGQMFFSQMVFRPKDIEPRIMMILLTNGDFTKGTQYHRFAIMIGCFVKKKKMFQYEKQLI
jgi:hypothetical protein